MLWKGKRLLIKLLPECTQHHVFICFCIRPFSPDKCYADLQFFQQFLKKSGVLDRLEEEGIEEGDTVRMYGHEFSYYRE